MQSICQPYSSQSHHAAESSQCLGSCLNAHPPGSATIVGHSGMAAQGCLEPGTCSSADRQWYRSKYKVFLCSHPPPMKGFRSCHYFILDNTPVVSVLFCRSSLLAVHSTSQSVFTLCVRALTQFHICVAIWSWSHCWLHSSSCCISS